MVGGEGGTGMIDGDGGAGSVVVVEVGTGVEGDAGTGVAGAGVGEGVGECVALACSRKHLEHMFIVEVEPKKPQPLAHKGREEVPCSESPWPLSTILREREKRK